MSKVNLNHFNDGKLGMVEKIDQNATLSKKLRGPQGPLEYIDFFGEKMTINHIAKIYGLNRNALLQAYNLTSNIDEAISLCVNNKMEQTNNEEVSIRGFAENYQSTVKNAVCLDKLKNFAYGSFPKTSYQKNCALLNDRVDPIEETESKVVNDELRVELMKAMVGLNARNQKIVRLYYGLEDGCFHTYEEIGNLFGLSKERVRQVIFHFINRLKCPARSKNLTNFLENVK